MGAGGRRTEQAPKPRSCVAPEAETLGKTVPARDARGASPFYADALMYVSRSSGPPGGNHFAISNRDPQQLGFTPRFKCYLLWLSQRSLLQSGLCLCRSWYLRWQCPLPISLLPG